MLCMLINYWYYYSKNNNNKSYYYSITMYQDFIKFLKWLCEWCTITDTHFIADEVKLQTD